MKKLGMMKTILMMGCALALLFAAVPQPVMAANSQMNLTEIKIVEEKDSGKLVWECPNCGNRDQDKMSVARRTCGYIGTQFWNQGRTQEIKERVLHL